ncbi:MAG: hypothetical protein ACYDAK_11755 [Candidatus Limnocylindrales bacterium]
MGWTAPVRAAVRRTLEDPGLWPIALAGFLVRGGIGVVLLPLIPLPSAVGLANLVGPTAVTAAGPTSSTILALGAVAAVALGAVLLGVALGAIMEATLVRAALQPPLSADRPRRFGRLVGVRLVALLPLALVVVAVAPSVGEAVYRELLTPSDIAVSLVERVVRASVPQIAAVVATWIAVEAIGGVALRIVLVEDASTVRALGRSVLRLVRDPLASAAAVVAGLAGLLVALVPALGAPAAARSAVHDLIASAAPPPLIGLWIVLLVTAWLVGLTILAIAAAWRSALWTTRV